ncbi:MAG: ABC transporter ATP-binding protein [Candidatus Bipolaricaulota bacterium]|nr:ABC transporter ATP-binding protein [Candidatus Bipolaricaulota bacterium]MDW8127337.1 ABC transporter ATP-binding protein [Candidatus Bipolaricaulota bacterium]
MTTFVELRGVVKDYPMGQTVFRALRGVDLAVAEGQFLAITGPSGSGKSTLLHLMGALHRPTQGQIIFEGVDLATLSADELAHLRNSKIGFVFQQFHLLPRITAWENVALPMAYARVRPAVRKERALAALARVGLGDFAYHRPNQLSGGQQQRVAIARALVNNPKLLLADEPTGNLDTQSGREIVELFSSLHKEGHTVVIVTHEPEIAAVAQRIVVLRDGLIQEERHGLR